MELLYNCFFLFSGSQPRYDDVRHQAQQILSSPDSSIGNVMNFKRRYFLCFQISFLHGCFIYTDLQIAESVCGLPQTSYTSERELNRPPGYQFREEEHLNKKVVALNDKTHSKEDHALTAVGVKGKSWKRKETQQEQQQKKCTNNAQNSQSLTRENKQQSGRATQKHTSAEVVEETLNGRAITYPTSIYD